MTFHYVKRLRMEIDLRHRDSARRFRRGYRWVPWCWSADFIERHAETKYLSFSKKSMLTYFRAWESNGVA